MGSPSRLFLELELGEDDNGLVDERALVWVRDSNGPGEQRVIWAHDVAEYLQGEVANGEDDNGNGLIDEAGLSFVRQGNRLFVRLTLQDRDLRGNALERTVETSVRLRN